MKHLDDTSTRTPDEPQGLLGGSPAAHPEQAMAARRRLLLRAAASSAPVVLGLIPATGQAASSAFRLADADAQRTPAGYIPSGGVDDAKWMRAPAKTFKIVEANNEDKVVPNFELLFDVNGRFYTPATSTAAGVDVTTTVTELLAQLKNNGNGASDKLAYKRVYTGDVLVLKLFDECSLADSGKVWPEGITAGNLQGLTLSAWTSVAGFTRSCNYNLSGS